MRSNPHPQTREYARTDLTSAATATDSWTGTGLRAREVVVSMAAGTVFGDEQSFLMFLTKDVVILKFLIESKILFATLISKPLFNSNSSLYR